MFPVEGNGVRPYRQDSFESWHQALPQPPRPTQNPDRYKWDNINALFEDQVQMVSVTPSKPGTSKSKGKKVHHPGSIKLKRLGKIKAGRKWYYLKISSKGRKWSLKPLKRGTAATTSLLQNTKKKFKKPIRE